MKILFAVFSVLILLYSLYFFVFALYGMLKKPKQYPAAGRFSHFAILIPARNEESVIGDLLQTIRLLDYPADCFDTYVIVNHCTDNTESIAREFGAKILPCDAQTQTKGEVLRLAFRELASHKEIDVYAIVDADNTVSASFLQELNKAVLAGFPAAQTVRTGRNSKNSWIAGCYEIYYRFQNAFFNHPRSAAGLPASINGSGWAVTKDLIERNGFDTVTITEDIEYTILCGLTKDNIAFVSNAESCDQFVSDWKTSWRQRVRWTFGALQCIRQYQGRLLANAFRGSFVSFDLFMINYLIPVTAFGLLLIPFGYLTLRSFLSFPLYLLCAYGCFYVTACIAGLLSVVITRGSIHDTWKGILIYPLFLLSWVPLFIACLFRRDIAWTPIRKSEEKK